ncbi:MAG: alpha/beta family hydrolase, partial [Rubrivivax sp.]
MPGFTTQPSTIVIDAELSVDALLCSGANAAACLVLAHGAGAGMAHPFMASFADGLAERSIASLRFQFPFMQRSSKRPDPPPVAHAAVRAAAAHAAQRLPGVPLLAGGKSFGARMSSQAQALSALPGVLGLVFVGFPLHPAGKPS